MYADYQRLHLFESEVNQNPRVESQKETQGRHTSQRARTMPPQAMKTADDDLSGKAHPGCVGCVTEQRPCLKGQFRRSAPWPARKGVPDVDGAGKVVVGYRHDPDDQREYGRLPRQEG